MTIGYASYVTGKTASFTPTDWKIQREYETGRIQDDQLFEEHIQDRDMHFERYIGWLGIETLSGVFVAVRLMQGDTIIREAEA